MALLTSVPSLAWDDSRKDYNRTDKDNTPKSYTLSGDSYGSRKGSADESDSKTSRKYDRGSEELSRGSYSGSKQINDNGLIINRE